jgi:SulP family sulfate permease
MNRVFREIAQNWKSGLTVAMVSVPLSLALAIASGATPVMGIITAVWAGLVAAALGGSEYNVVGPAGALSGILVAFALTVGVQYLPLLALLSGALVFVCYIFKWEKYLVFIPSSVMHGFTLGVGLTIGLGQLNSALGLSGLPVHESALLNIWESLTHVSQFNPLTAGLFLSLLLLLFVLARFFPRIPGAVVIVVP